VMDGCYFALRQQVAKLESANAGLTLELRDAKEDAVAYADVAREMEDSYNALIANNKEVERRGKAAEEATQDVAARLAAVELAFEELKAQQVQHSKPALEQNPEPVPKRELERREMILRGCKRVICKSENKEAAPNAHAAACKLLTCKISPDATWAMIAAGSGMTGFLALLSFRMTPLLITVPDQTIINLLFINWRRLFLIFEISFTSFVTLFTLAEAWHCWYTSTPSERKQCTRKKMASATECIQVGDHREEIPATLLPELVVADFPPSSSLNQQDTSRQVKRSLSSASQRSSHTTSRQLKRSLSSASLQSSSLTKQTVSRRLRDSVSSDSLMQIKRDQSFSSQQYRCWKSEPLIDPVAGAKQYKRKVCNADASDTPTPLFAVSEALVARPAQHQRVHKTSAANFYTHVVYSQRLQAAAHKHGVSHIVPEQAVSNICTMIHKRQPNSARIFSV
jgi:hypothetical protein